MTQSTGGLIGLRSPLTSAEPLQGGERWRLGTTPELGRWNRRKRRPRENGKSHQVLAGICLFGKNARSVLFPPPFPFSSGGGKDMAARTMPQMPV